MFQRSQQRAVLLLAAVDTILAVIAFEGAFWTRSALPMREFHLDPPARALVLAAAVVLVVAAGRLTGVHSRLYAHGRAQAVGGTARQVLAAAPALLAFLYLLNLEVPVSRLFLTLFFAYLAMLLVAQRLLFERFLGRIRRALGAVTSIVVVGDGERAIALARDVEDAGRHGLRLLAVVDCGNQIGPLAGLASDCAVLAIEDFPAMLESEAIDEVLFAVSSQRLRSLEGLFVLCDEHGVKTRVAADFFPHVHSRMHFDRLGERPLLTFSIAPSDDLGLLAKRCLDVIAAAICLAALAVPMGVIAVLIKLTSPGPVLFRQARCGLNGRLFTCYKLRSMAEGADSMRQQVEHLNEKDGPAFKIRNDPRLTPIGGFLRRFSVDEWPQFWNVLRGEMSLVGPRPAIPAEVAEYKPWQRRRLRMRPGLTCLWAIRGRDRVDFSSWMQMDLEYIDNWSLLLDLKILALTIPVVLAGSGAS